VFPGRHYILKQFIHKAVMKLSIRLMKFTQSTMKKVALSVIGGSLFVAGYYHVHRQADYLATQSTLASAKTPTPPINIPPIKSLPAFAFRLN
jgi:hypothetical protein